MKFHIPLSHEEELRYAAESFSDVLAKSAAVVDSMTQKLKETLPAIIRGFSSTQATVDLPVIETLDKYQKKFLDEVEKVPYSETRELKAFVPEGMKVSYLEYLKVLTPVTLYLKDIQRDVTSPYLFLLAQMVSDTNANLSTNNQKPLYKRLEAYRKEAYDRFSNLYRMNSYEAQTKVMHVVDRNADWKEILVQLKNCKDNVEAVDREAIQRQVKQCTDYLEIIHQNLSNNKAKPASKEMAQGLADGAYAVAQELQFFSTTYYRVLAMSGSLKNTIEHIQNCI